MNIVALQLQADHGFRGAVEQRLAPRMAGVQAQRDAAVGLRELVAGLQLQSDDIHNGLYDTQARMRTATTREDHVRERSAGVYVQNAIKWNPWFRTVLGAREDYFHNDVTSWLPVNSGTATGRQFSPKAAFIFGPWDKTEFYVNLGRGFHSNDARGTTIRVDPKNPDTAATTERALVASKGLELG